MQFYPKKSLNGNLALSYAHCRGRKEMISRSYQGKIAIQRKKQGKKTNGARNLVMHETNVVVNYVEKF